MEDHDMDDKELEQDSREFSNMKRKRKSPHRADDENVDQEFKGGKSAEIFGMHNSSLFYGKMNALKSTSHSLFLRYLFSCMCIF